MRDKKRIKDFCNELAELWEQVPDIRFFQLILNVVGDKDMFYIEDGDALGLIADFVEEMKPHKAVEPTAAPINEIQELKKEIKELREFIDRVYENQLRINDLSQIGELCKDLFID